MPAVEPSKSPAPPPHAPEAKSFNWTRWIPLALIAILLIACDLRFFEIDTRPPHSDEGVNFLFIGTTNKQGYYPYSHQNYHGPLFFYLITGVVNLLGDSLLDLRLTAIVCGILTVVACFPLAALSSWTAALTAGLLVAISPSLVFFSRYAIHESLFVLASFGFALSCLAWRARKRPVHWYLLGFFLAVLVTTKETFIIFLFGLVAASLALDLGRSDARQAWEQRKHIGYAYLLFITLVLFTFTAAFRWPDGIGEMFLAFPQWLGRSDSDTGHFKRFAYYLYDVIWITEGYLAIAFVGTAIALAIELALGVRAQGLRALTRGRGLALLAATAFWLLHTGLIYISSKRSTPATTDPAYLNPYLLTSILLAVFLFASVVSEAAWQSFLGRKRKHALFFGLWSLSSFIVYSYVQYKTVWLVINLTLPATIFAALVIAALVENRNVFFRTLGAGCFLATLVTVLPSTFRYNFVRYPVPGTDIALSEAHPYGLENPFSYVHTSPGMLDLVQEVEEYWKKKPDAKVLIGLEGYFPLPYYFRHKQNQCGYEVPKDIDAASKNYDVLILDFYKQKWGHPDWYFEYNRLSDYTESQTYFKRLPGEANPQ